jgi:hypothetical protein
MALSPLQPREERAVEVSQVERASPTKTYKLDFETGKISGIVDGKDALKQFIHKAIITARFRFPIYDDQYGCELDDLIGQDIPYELFETEVKRVIKDALIYDDRINDVTNFNIEKTGDKVYISFTVDSIYGDLNNKVVI